MAMAVAACVWLSSADAYAADTEANAEAASAAEKAEIVRPVNSSYMLSVGSSHLGDTYLSPLKYTGWHAAFDYDRIQAMKFSPERWRQQLRISVEFNHADNPARNATLYYLNVHASWGMLRRWALPYNIGVAVGGNAALEAGCTYSARNGNNPASAKVDITVGVSGHATWKTRLGRMPVMLLWQTSMPLTGAFFSPEYDELYYEIYLGNRSGLVHWALPWNMFRWDNLVCADLDVSSTRLRVGFRSRIFSSEVNNITTRIFSYGFVVGATGDWMSVSPRNFPSKETMSIVYAY